MKYFFWLIVFIMVMTGCENQPTSKNDNNEKAEEVKTKSEQEETPQVEETVSYKQSPPVKMDPSLALEPLQTFKTNTRKNENKAIYDLKVELKRDGQFHVTADIKVTNLSKDSWDDLVFHFIPNAFSEKHKPDFLKSSAEVRISEVLIESEEAKYKLDKDTLQVLLNDSLTPDQGVKVSISYQFTVPEEGIRLSTVKGNYYLAQWYPMLSPYHSGWDKADFDLGGEYYHSDFSDFKVEMSLPENYTVVSSADGEGIEKEKLVSLSASNIKEMYVALLKDMPVSSAVVDGTEIRVFSYKEDQQYQQEYLELAKSALVFFNTNFGKYPHQQLDIIMDEGGMEYPGIVTVATGNRNSHTVVHEIAHQWFYGIVSNHPYHTAWIDEGLTNFATYLYFMKGEQQDFSIAFSEAEKRLNMSKDYGPLLPSNLSISEYREQPMSYMGSVYQNTPLELWELAGDADRGLDYLKTYYNLYAYQEVDANEWLRFTRAYFNISNVEILKEWISFEQ